jgi:hypothetical protein
VQPVRPTASVQCPILYPSGKEAIRGILVRIRPRSA